MKIFFIFLLLAVTVNVSGQKAPDVFLSTDKAFKEYPELRKNPFYAFPQSRDYSIQWNDSLSLGWLKDDYSKQAFMLQSQPDEHFVFQIGAWAIQHDLHDLKLEFSDFKASDNRVISSRKISCFNAGGIDYLGKPFTRKIAVSKGKMQPLWVGVDFSGVSVGDYEGFVDVKEGAKSQRINLRFQVRGEPVINHGYNEGSRLSRLNWLNSTTGINDSIVDGFLPVKRSGNTLHILGRTLEISKNGLPSGITSYFKGSNQGLTDKGSPIIDQAFHFVIEKEDGSIVKLKPGAIKFTETSGSAIKWEVVNSAPECELVCTGRLEFDGFVDYKLTLKALKPLKVKDIRLEVPMNKSKAEYMMGLNHEGGLRPESWAWSWDITKHQDALWLGAVNGGLRIKLKSDNYVMPLVNIYYAFGRLNLPDSWGNGNKGGVKVKEEGSSVLFNAYSGDRQMEAGHKLHYDFELLITPFKTVDTEKKFGDRYFSKSGVNAFGDLEEAKAAGANILNIHHAADIYPFINYPYIDENVSSLKQLVNKTHRDSLLFILYYTTRELTKNTPEFMAFYSLDGEVLYPGPGNASRTKELHPNGPNKWLIKNLREKYVPAWYNPIHEGKFKGDFDLTVLTTPNSRLNNYYIAGLEWMLKNMDIDGVYIDDSALDRFTLIRARKLIDKYSDKGRIDFHSWNHFVESAGYANCLNLYMDLLPYFDVVRIGEGRDYNREHDHWLIEVSGIPFGVPGVMLPIGKDQLNLWRGMVYGISGREPYEGGKGLWKYWDEAAIQDKEYLGYWDKDCLVRVNNDRIKASFYKGEQQSIVALANWSAAAQKVDVKIDWAALGYNPAECTIEIPYIENFQEKQDVGSLSSFDVPARKGFLIQITRKP